MKSLGLSFSDLRSAWDQYAPGVRADLKELREDWKTAQENAQTTTPINLTPTPVPQAQSKGPSAGTLFISLLGLGLLGGGSYYLYSRGYFGKIKK